MTTKISFDFGCSRCDYPLSVNMTGTQPLLDNPSVSYTRTTVPCPNCHYDNRIVSVLQPDKSVRRQVVPCDEKDKKGPAFKVTTGGNQ